MKAIKNTKKIAIVSIIAIAIIFTVLFINNQNKSGEFIAYNEFVQMLDNDLISHIIISDGSIIQFALHNSPEYFTTNNPRSQSFKEDLLLRGVAVSEGNPTELSGFISLAVLGLIGFIAFKAIAKTSGKKAMALEVEVASETEMHTNFSNVAGNDEAKESVADIVDFIKNPNKYAVYGARMPRGIMLYGPPGTGKTLMAKAIAGEAGVPFYATSGSDFVQMYVGVGASRIRELFKKARAAERAVIFIDEIDAVGKKRNGGNGGNDERDQTLNALLTEMSGFSGSEGIVVVAATNRLDSLDDALLRPGRFDRHIEIGLPDIIGRRSIINIHAKDKPLDVKINLDEIAKQTVYFSGAMLENLLNEAAINAAKAGKNIINQADIDSAYFTIIAGSERKNRSDIADNEKQITACHEAGHALAAKILSPENSVLKVSIIPSTKGAAGFCINVPKDKMYFTKKELESQIIILLSGRAAEECSFGKDNVTTGASNDIQRANQIAKEYIVKFGMGSSGLAEPSENEVSAEVKNLLKRLYNESLSILEKHSSKLGKVVNALIEKESLSECELNELIA